MDAALIQWICVARPTDVLRPRPVDAVQPPEKGGWAYCPAGATENHLWYRTGGLRRAALDRFEWPSEDEIPP